MSNIVSYGFRVSTKDFSCAALSGTRETPKVALVKTIKLPSGYSVQQRLRWIHLEINSIFNSLPPRVVTIKADESRGKTDGALQRAMNEGMIYRAVADLGHNIYCHKKRILTLAKDLGGKGKSKYLQQFDKSPIPSFGSYSSNEQDAILCAWSELK